MMLYFLAIANFPIEFCDVIEVVLTENLESWILITYESKILMAKEVKLIQGDKKIRTHNFTCKALRIS